MNRHIVYEDGERRIVERPDEPDTGPRPLPRAQAERARRAAYAAEADHLYFEAQAGERDIADWHAARAAIKARYPIAP